MGNLATPEALEPKDGKTAPPQYGDRGAAMRAQADDDRIERLHLRMVRRAVERVDRHRMAAVAKSTL